MKRTAASATIQNRSRYGDVSETRNPARRRREPPEIATKSARRMRPRQSSSAAETQTGAGDDRSLRAEGSAREMVIRDVVAAAKQTGPEASSRTPRLSRAPRPQFAS